RLGWRGRILWLGLCLQTLLLLQLLLSLESALSLCLLGLDDALEDLRIIRRQLLCFRKGLGGVIQLSRGQGGSAGVQELLYGGSLLLLLKLLLTSRLRRGSILVLSLFYLTKPVQDRVRVKQFVGFLVLGCCLIIAFFRERFLCVLQRTRIELAIARRQRLGLVAACFLLGQQSGLVRLR